MTSDGTEPPPQPVTTPGDRPPAASRPCVVHHIDTPEGLEIRREMLAAAPRLQTMLNYIAAKQAGPSERMLRWYQRELFEQHFFRVPSPYTGNMIRSGDSFVLLHRKPAFRFPTRPGKTVFRFPSEPGLLLAATNLGEGFPINAILMPALADGAGLGLAFGSRIWGLSTEDATRALSELSAPEWRHMAPAREVAAICSDPNFAHFIWNQMPALRELVTLPRHKPPATIYPFFEPTGDIETLVPELQDWPIARSTQYTTPNAPGRVSFCFGSSQMDRATRAALHRRAEDAVTAEISALIAKLGGHTPVVWISVRTRNRTATNQIQFLIDLCRAIIDGWSGSLILLDGHSYAEDDYRQPIEDSRQSIASDKAEIAAVMNAVAALCPAASDRMIDASGLSILNSIALAGHADFYVCHHGSVQHKIGWTTTVPGVVHSNRRVIDMHPAHWVAEQAGHDVLPVYFPGELIEDIPDSGTSQIEEVNSLLNENYRFIDPEAAITFVLEHLDRHQKRSAPEPPASNTDATTTDPSTDALPDPDSLIDMGIDTGDVRADTDECEGGDPASHLPEDHAGSEDPVIVQGDVAENGSEAMEYASPEAIPEDVPEAVSEGIMATTEDTPVLSPLRSLLERLKDLIWS